MDTLRNNLAHILVLAVFVVLAAVLTWPLPQYLALRYPAESLEGAQDLWQNIWNLWWAGEALRRGIDPFLTDMLFFPNGGSLLFHPLNLTQGLLSVPLQQAFGMVVAYNLLALLSFVLSGYAVALLARAHGCGWWAGLAGGLAYTAAAFHFEHLRLGHLEQISMHWLPLYALALDGVLRFPPIAREEPVIGARMAARVRGEWPVLFGRRLLSVLRVLVAALLLLAIIYTSLYTAIFAGLLTLVWLIWRLGLAQREPNRPDLRPGMLGLLAVGLLVLLVVGPTLLLPMALEAQRTDYMLRSVNDAMRGSSALGDAFLPPPSHPLRAVAALPPPQNRGAFLGYLALVLALVGVLAFPRRAGRWVVLGLLAWLLSLGPGFPLYQALYQLPPMQVARYPGHFSVLVLLCVSVLAALGVEALVQRVMRIPVVPPRMPEPQPMPEATQAHAEDDWPAGVLPRRAAPEPQVPPPDPAQVRALQVRGTLVGMGMLVLLLFELHPRGVTLVMPIANPFYQQLAREDGQFSVFELPINRANNMWVDMAAQTLHGKPILYGGLARDLPRPPFENMALFRELERPDLPQDIVKQTTAERLAALRFFGLHYLLYHRSDENGPVVPPTAVALTQAAGTPLRVVYEDAELVAYRLDLPQGTAVLPPFASVGAGWYDLEPRTLRGLRWLRGERGALVIYAPQATRIVLRMRMVAFAQPHLITLLVDDRPVGQLDVPTAPTELRTPVLELQPGVQTLWLVPTTDGVSPQSLGQGDDPRVLTVGLAEVWIEAAPDQ